MPDDIDAPEYEPLPKREPVAVADLAKLAIFAAGWAGVDLPEDTATKIVAGVIALILFVQTTWFARSRVTPVDRADAAVAEARAAEVAAASAAIHAAAATPATSPGLDLLLATVKEQGRVEPVAPPPPAVGPIPYSPTRLPPPAGLD